MTTGPSSRRRLLRIAQVAGAAVAIATAAAAGVPGVASATPAPQANGHAYRHGVVPTRGSHAVNTASGTGNMYYHGGTSGNGANVGVVTGPPKVYLVFWGSQWGTQSTNGAGNATFTGDPVGMAPDLQAFFKGLGTGGELWSGVMTQYCQGVASGTYTCPTGSAQVGYPTGGALAGVWADESAAAPGTANQMQLVQEAMTGASHFGLTGANSRNDQIFVVSPTGTHPDGFGGTSNFCAWHDHSADPAFQVPVPFNVAFDIAFTNMPYVTDLHTSCGQNFVNAGSAGTLDGVTIVGGHEYAETITDQFPNSDSFGNITSGGWADSSSYENGDKCAWISSGQGASANLSLTTGTFAVQSTYANDFNGGAGDCELSHPIVGGGSSGTLTFAGSGQTLTAGTPSAALSVTASSGSPSVTVSSNSATGTFATTSGGTYSPTITVPAGTSFYYKDTTAGTPTLTASASGYTSGSQVETVVAGQLAHISVSPSSVTLALGGSQVFTATGTDSYNNPVSVSGAAWTTTAPGGVSPATGSSTTFTASTTTPGSGSVTATVGSVSGSASVTVQSAKVMSVSVTSGTTRYRSGSYRTPLTVTAKDASTGAALAGDPVSITIYSGACGSGGGAVTSGSGTTNSSGQAGFTFSTRTVGTYCAVATVTASGYTPGSGSKTFTN